MKISRFLNHLLLAAALVAAAAMPGCGGGGGGGDTTAGVGSGGTGLSVGTVTGFGSVIVDGVTIDDRNAKVQAEVAPGQFGDADAAIGQQVEIETNDDGSAKTIRIAAQVIGPIQAVDTTAARLTVAGQAVAINSDANLGPVTLFEGYTVLADIKVGDLVEVHGIDKVDAATGVHIIQATRIEKRTAPLAFIRISGTIGTLDSTAKTFTVGSLTVGYGSATLVPASRQLAVGQRVVVFGPSLSGNTLTAQLVRIAEPKAKGTSARVGGVVTNLVPATLTFVVNGVTVDASKAVIVPANRTLANEAYVRVKGTIGDNGVLIASQVEIRKKADSDFVNEVSLKGTITDFVSLASFKVRGAPVDASHATLEGCSNGLSAGLFVAVEGNVTGQVVTATKVKCQTAGDSAEIEAHGTISAVDTVNHTLVLTTASGTINVRWTDLTSFRDITVATLSGANVEIEGYLQANVLVARKIKR